MPRSARRALGSYRRRHRLLALPVLALVAALGAATAPPVASAAPTSYQVRVIAFNDLHGNLEPPSGSSGRVFWSGGKQTDSTGATYDDAGGVAYLAAHIKQLRAQAKHSLVVSGGDNIGASPLASALFHDEPTIDALNEMDVLATAVGNHEFDDGYPELLRIQGGGCHPDGCTFDPSFDGARFPILGANVTKANGLPALLPYTVKYAGTVPIGIIGITLEDLPSVVTPAAITGLRFGDEVAAIDRTSKVLESQGIRAQIVLMHQGDEVTGGDPNDCNLDPDGDLASVIARRSRAQVDAFFTGHTHQSYDCVVPDPSGRLRTLTQAGSFGRVLSVVDLTLNTRTQDVVRSAKRSPAAQNVVVTRDVTPDPTLQTLVTRAVSQAGPIANERVGTITADILGRGASTPELPLGDVIADAQLAATTGNGAQIALTNPGGIRSDLTYASSSAGEGDGVVTYGEAFTVQPFSNILQTVTLTGAQLKAVLEQQSDNPSTGATRFLQISDGLTYTWTRSAAVGSRVSKLALNGTAITPTGRYRVTVNNFLAAGGDGFTTFTQGTNLAGGPIDLDAFTDYLGDHPNLAPPAATRITIVS